ncbi:hypothetical protein [Lactobacillus sp. Sy-1]|uniref:hypothetical protein n=1 Tax=Lactobacillus sp. Sy-1 TaxID=2109645 RepID=UPI001C567BBC|nr:hypothetical protein [Lactobacillus sp. Sy-1]MBW1605273.1 hypothetical protein [Lactobacillus sp. Sy-1]
MKLKPYLYTTTVLATLAATGAFSRIANADVTSAATATTQTTSTNNQPTAANATVTTDLTATTATKDATTLVQTAKSTKSAEAIATNKSSSVVQSTSRASVASSASADVSTTSVVSPIVGKNTSYSSASVNVNSQTISTMESFAAKYPDIVDPTFNQNFHFNTSDGYSNDIQSMMPHYANDGSIKYWDIYYLAQPLAKHQGVQYEWKHMVTTDFKTFQDFDTSNRFSINNVAIPDKYYVNSIDNSPFQVSDTNKTGIPWGAAASGTVINNNGLLKVDQFGNAIDSDAKLAYFTNFTNGQSIYLAYSNKDGQFHPYSMKPVMNPKTISGLEDKTDFRDPYVMQTKAGGFVAYVAGGLDDRMYVLTSIDGVNWTYQPQYTIDLTGYHVSEMPVVKTLNGQPMMFFIAGSKDYTGNQSGSYVITGSFNTDGVFTKTPESKVTKMDDGFDNFAANYASLSANKLVSMAWLGNWTYSPNLFNYNDINHFGSYTLARTITYKNGNFLVDPIEPTSKLVGNYNLKAKSTFAVGTDNKVALNFNGDQTVKLTRQDGTNNNVTIKTAGNTLTITRSWNMNSSMNKTTTINVGKATKQAILYVDNSSIELYLPEVHKMYTLLTFSYKQNSGYNMTLANRATVSYSTFNFNTQTVTAENIKTTLATAKQQSQKRVSDSVSEFKGDWKQQMSRADYKQAVQSIQKQSKAALSALKSASTMNALIKAENSFNTWLNKLSTQVASTVKTITIKKNTKIYTDLNGDKYNQATKRTNKVAVNKVVNSNGQIWYQVKINNQIGYIQK